MTTPEFVTAIVVVAYGAVCYFAGWIDRGQEESRKPTGRPAVDKEGA